MIGFDRVLVPLDGSTRAEAALRWVHLLPARQVRLLRICDEAHENRADALRYLDNIAHRLRLMGATVDSRIVAGDPAERIVDEAAESDLIVMSTQGAGGGGGMLCGSVADRVARHAPVPALLARGGAAPLELAPLRRVVVPLDGSPAAERALRFAAGLARILPAALHLIAVDETASDADLSEPESDQPRRAQDASPETRLYLENQAARLHESGLSPSLESCRGDPMIELLTRVVPGDLLVMTTHGRGAARRWQIGSVAEKLLRHAAAPVVLLRADRG